jgi:DNA-binding HxlR family transcriptional regulator
LDAGDVRGALQLFFFRLLCFLLGAGRNYVDVEDRLSPDIDAFRTAALNCPIPAAIDLVGEKWAFLILRGAFNGLQHFEEFQAGLGTARNILSDRLAKLVAGGILKRSPDPSDKRKVIYSLTAKGEALLPAVVAIRQWGEDWTTGEMQIVLADQQNRRPIRRIKVLAEDGRELKLADLTWISRDEVERKAEVERKTGEAA